MLYRPGCSEYHQKLGICLSFADLVLSYLQYGGNPVACSIGLAVLDVISNEKLQSAAKMVGRCLMDGFNAIQDKHPMMGNIRY